MPSSKSRKQSQKSAPATVHPESEPSYVSRTPSKSEITHTVLDILAHKLNLPNRTPLISSERELYRKHQFTKIDTIGKAEKELIDFLKNNKSIEDSTTLKKLGKYGILLLDYIDVPKLANADTDPETFFLFNKTFFDEWLNVVCDVNKDFNNMYTMFRLLPKPKRIYDYPDYVRRALIDKIYHKTSPENPDMQAIIDQLTRIIADHKLFSAICKQTSFRASAIMSFTRQQFACQKLKELGSLLGIAPANLLTTLHNELVKYTKHNLSVLIRNNEHMQHLHPLIKNIVETLNINYKPGVNALEFIRAIMLTSLPGHLVYEMINVPQTKSKQQIYNSLCTDAIIPFSTKRAIQRFPALNNMNGQTLPNELFSPTKSGMLDPAFTGIFSDTYIPLYIYCNLVAYLIRLLVLVKIRYGPFVDQRSNNSRNRNSPIQICESLYATLYLAFLGKRGNLTPIEADERYVQDIQNQIHADLSYLYNRIKEQSEIKNKAQAAGFSVPPDLNWLLLRSICLHNKIHAKQKASSNKHKGSNHK